MNPSAYIPGTQVPICQVCRDDHAPHYDSAVGAVCDDCIPDLAAATVCLAEARLFHHLTQPKNSNEIRPH